MLPDSGDASVVVVGGGVLPSNPDSGIDATGPCHPCGVIIHPEGGFD